MEGANGCKNTAQHCPRGHFLVSRAEFEKMTPPRKSKPNPPKPNGDNGTGEKKDEKGKGGSKGNGRIPKLCKEYAEKKKCSKPGCRLVHLPQADYDKLVAEHKNKKAAAAAEATGANE